MRIAIIGSGISGLVAARRLHRQHDVTVFEAAEWIGGHTHTIDVECDGRVIPIDTGFIVFNAPNYPHFNALLNELNVESQPTRMSFSVSCERTNTEYSGGSVRGLFAQKRNLMRPRFWGLLGDLMRFHREAERALNACDDGVSVQEYIEREGYGDEFVQRFLTPMGSSLWSCPPGTFLRFPMRFVVEFFRNHHMLQSFGRPTWRVVRGGSQRYVDAMIKPFRDRIQTSCPVRRVVRMANEVVVQTDGRNVGGETFDHVIFACHADQALRLLKDADAMERQTLSAFPYQTNDVVVHTDESILPRRRRARSAWNFRTADDQHPPCVTYNMNILQSIEASQTFCVTLNATHRIDPKRIIARYTYEHPTFDQRRAIAWTNAESMACRNRTSFCGAYWGYGFHEDGVVSALRVCDAIERRAMRPPICVVARQPEEIPA